MNGLRYSLLLGLSIAWTGCLAQDSGLSDTDKQEVVRQTADMLGQSYIFPDIGAKAGGAIKEALAANKYAAISDPKAFAAQLTTDLQAVTHDLHMRVRSREPGPQPPSSQGAPERLQSDGGFVRVDRLKGNIGYIRLDGFPPPASLRDPADEAMRLVAGTDALIIDLRENYGGDPASVAYLCSFFFDPKHPVHLNDLVWRKEGTADFTRQEFWTVPVPSHYLGKPVILLSSGETFSGGEEFLNDMKVLHRAPVIGERSGGGANPGGMMPLAHHFAIFIPTGRAENPVTKSNWEGTGVQPDIAVAPDKALGTAVARIAKKQVDPAASLDSLVEVSLMRAARTGPHPQSEAVLRRLLAGISSGEPDFADLRPSGAEGEQEVAGQARQDMKTFGALRQVVFQRIDEMGGDVFHLTFENGAADWAIVLDRADKIVALDYHPL